MRLDGSSPVQFKIDSHDALQIKGIFDNFPELRPSRDYGVVKTIVIDELRQQGAFETSDPDKSMFCRAMLSILSFLLSCGMYTHETDTQGISTALYPEGMAVGQVMPLLMQQQLGALLDVIVDLLDNAGAACMSRAFLCSSY